MADVRIVPVPESQVDGLQEWVRETDDQDVRGVSALQHDVDGRWNWQVEVWVAEFLREEPLEGEMRRLVDQAIRSVAGVAEVEEGDREVWILSGSPSGEDLVRAVGDAIDQIAPRARAHIDGLV